MKLFFLIPLTVMGFSLFAAPVRPTVYIEKHVKIAQEEMKRTGVPPSITLSQSMIESTCGTSHIAVTKNNYFGIKEKGRDTYKTYATVKASFMHHSNVLARNRRYARLLYKGDYEAWALAIGKSGYAADGRTYARQIIAYIKRYRLYRFDRQVV